MLKKVNELSGLITLLTVLAAILLNFVEFKTEIKEVSAKVSGHAASCEKSHESGLALIGSIKSEQTTQAVNNRFLLKMAENSNTAVIEMTSVLKEVKFLLTDIRNEQSKK